MRPSLFVSTPAYGGLVTTQYLSSILGLWTAARSAGIDISWNPVSGSLVTQSRNELVAQFMHASATHLFFIDADIGFTSEQVIEMLRFDQPFVAGVYPLKAFPTTVVGKKAEPCERRGRFLTGEFCGAGFMLLKREVIERRIEAYPEARYTKHYGGESACPEYHALFDCMIYEGEYNPEDYGLCRRWRAIGGDIWLDMGSKLTHTGAHTFILERAVHRSESRFTTNQCGSVGRRRS